MTPQNTRSILQGRHTVIFVSGWVSLASFDCLSVFLCFAKGNEETFLSFRARPMIKCWISSRSYYECKKN